MQSLPTQRYRRQAVRDNLDIVGQCIACLQLNSYDQTTNIYVVFRLGQMLKIF